MVAGGIITQFGLTPHPEGGWYREVHPLGGGEPVSVVPAGIWQAARSLGAYSPVGCSVGPGFEYADFRFVADADSRRR
jgi:predicted cupin superfamily sugar epimerase